MLFFNMREIEIKVKVADAKKAIESLQAKGIIFGDILTQNDRIFLPHRKTYDDLQVKQQGNNVLRLREQDGKIKFTLKQTQSSELD